MSNELTELVDDMVQPKDKSTGKKSNKTVCIGLDCGTMHLVCSRSDSEKVKVTRNVFLHLDSDDVSITELSDISYVEGDEGELFIIGEDAFKFANIFNQPVSRPMEKGLISPQEIDAIDILTLIIKNLIGDVRNKEVFCSFSVPAEAVDEGRSVIYHRKVLAQILNKLGINHTSVNEAMAIIFSECAKEKFSGIGISLGAGMANISVSYKGIEALKFSTARAGDWIDRQVATDLAVIPNRVTSIKEKYMDLTNEPQVKNKKTKRVLEALFYYHEALIDYTIDKIIKEFNRTVDIEVDESIPIIISGGTSLPKGFASLFKSIILSKDLPFNISEVRRAKNPMTAVANGLLVKTIADIKNK